MFADGANMGLNSKQKLFVKEYLVDRNATRAAKAAGYSKKTARAIGQENLTKPDIRKAIEAATKKVTDKLDITAERILGRIAQIAFEEEYCKRSDILKACELLGKHKSLFTENVNVNNSGPAPQVIITMPSNKRETNGG